MMTDVKHRLPLAALIIFTYACNLFDFLYTVYVLSYVSNAKEGNPVIGLLLDHPALLILYKFLILPLALCYLYYSRRKRMAVVGICLCALCFGVTVLYQILMIPNWVI